MSLIEIFANLLTVASVVLTSHLKKSLYPVGIAATILFFFVFLRTRLYASAGLQVYFTLIQVYGWWFWGRGDHGAAPPIGDWSWRFVALLGGVCAMVTLPIAWALHQFSDARMALADTAILVLSVLAQFLLDRKQLKNWLVWGVVDLLSILVYGGQGLWITAAVYGLLLANVFYGWARWRGAMTRPSLGKA